MAMILSGIIICKMTAYSGIYIDIFQIYWLDNKNVSVLFDFNLCYFHCNVFRLCILRLSFDIKPLLHIYISDLGFEIFM